MSKPYGHTCPTCEDWWAPVVCVKDYGHCSREAIVCPRCAPEKWAGMLDGGYICNGFAQWVEKVREGKK